MLLTNAVEIGGRLTETKELLPHGEWLKWLTESVSYSRSTASRLMKTFREYRPILSAPDEEEGPNGAPVHHLNYTQGLILFVLGQGFSRSVDPLPKGSYPTTIRHNMQESLSVKLSLRNNPWKHMSDMLPGIILMFHNNLSYIEGHESLL